MPLARLALFAILAVVASTVDLLANVQQPAGDVLPQLDKTGVVVPWEDFRKILEEIRRVDPPLPTPPPPVAFAFSACEVNAEVAADEKQVRVRLGLSIEVLATKDWVEVPVVPEGLALSRFEIDGRAANVYRKNGYHQIALRGAGRHELAVEYLAPVSDSRGSRSSYLRFPAAPVVALDLTVPRAGLDFKLDGAVVRSIERTDRRSRVLAALQQANAASVSWHEHVELDEKETKVLGELRTLISVGEGMLRGNTNALFTIHGKGTDLFRLSLPVDVTVLDVDAQGIRDWKVEPSSDENGVAVQQLQVRLNHLAGGSFSFHVSFERALGDTSAETSVPDLVLLDVLRDKGFIAVAAATNVEISPHGELRNATPVDPNELPPDLRSRSGGSVLYGFKYLQHPVQVGLSVVKHDDLAVKRTIVESAHLFTYLSPEGKRITSARYRIKNNRKQYLEVTLPEGGESWATYLDDRPIKAARSREGRVLIPLRKTAVGGDGELEPFDVELVYFERGAVGQWGRHEFDGPTLDVDVLEVEWHVFLPRDRRYAGFAGNLHPDEGLNRVLYVGTVAYNLGSQDDLALLQTEKEDGKTIVTDGRHRIVVGENLRGLDLRRIEGAASGEDEARENNELDMGRRADVDRVQQERKRIERRPRPASSVPAPMPMTQGMSNVGAASDQFFDRGGRAKGVLPVRFGIPIDGLRLSFGGRLLTAAEAPVVSMRYRPATWVLSWGSVLMLSLLFALVFVLLIDSEVSLSSRATGILTALIALVVLFLAAPGNRGAWAIGCAVALVVAAVRRWLRRPDPATALLAGLLLAGATLPSAALAAPAAPRASLPDLGGTEVTLAWKDFKALVEQTYVPPVVEPTPPTAAFLRSAEYRGKLEPGLLTLEGTLMLEVLQTGWVRVPFGSAGTVIDFRGDGALPNRNGNVLEVLARGPRSYRLEVSLAFPATERPGENRLAITLPDAARNLIDLRSAPTLRDVEVDSGLAYKAEGGHTFLSLSQGAFAVKYTLPFQRAEEEAGEEVKLEPRVQLDAYQMLNLGEGVISGVLIHDYQVRVAEVSHFDIDLPEGIVVFDCNVGGLESWKILQREGQRYLRVKLLAPASGRVRVVVSFEGSYDPAGGRVDVPRFAPQDVERESGFFGVAADGAEVELGLSGRLLPADVSEIPADIRVYGGNLIGACKYSGAPDAAVAAVTEHEDAPVLTAIIESLNATAAVLENGTEATWIDLTVKNNRKQFLKVRVPEGEVDVWSLLLDGEPAKPKRTGDDILVPLPRGNGEIAARISLVLLRKGDSPLGAFRSFEPRLPSFDVPVTEALWTVYLPEGRRYAASGDGFRPVLQTAALVPAGSVFRLAAGAEAPMEEASRAYGDAVSSKTADQQLRQEALIEQQLKQKGSSRKGALPVRVGLPGGLQQLPRVTMSRILIVGDEPNRFSIRAYPSWLSAVLGWTQPLLLITASLGFGLFLVGALGRSLLVVAVVLALVGMIPLGGLGIAAALFLLALATATTMAAVGLRRRYRREAD